MKLHVSPCPFSFIFDTRLLDGKRTKFKKLKYVVYFIINRREPFQYHNLNTILLTKLILRMVKTDSIIRKFFIEGVYCYYDNI